MKAVSIEQPIELEGFVADASVHYSLQSVNRAKTVESLPGYARFSGERVYLEGSFDVSELLAILYLLNEDEA